MYCTGDCMENYELLKASLNSYRVGGRYRKYYELLGRKSSLNGILSVGYSGTVLGHVRLPASEKIWDRMFPDHCMGRDVFFAVVFTRKANQCKLSEKFYKPAIAIVCHHHEYGLPYMDDLEDLAKLTRIVGLEAFKENTRVNILIDLFDNVLEKIVVFLIAENPSNPLGWRTPSKTLRQYSRTVRRQLTGHDRTKINIFMYQQSLYNNGGLRASTYGVVSEPPVG